ncbi:hypothetical protein CDAR_514941 [Caerostris darwini]|uniref:Uncharacterized protein n=1 Tax=Caerostris darwini TaxID=1538125 RepID=A0AAV4WXB5_9ARAC|nr:hypothetical protein CDAR_514941 [Caerostris darwini]
MPNANKETESPVPAEPKAGQHLPKERELEAMDKVISACQKPRIRALASGKNKTLTDSRPCTRSGLCLWLLGFTVCDADKRHAVVKGPEKPRGEVFGNVVF